MAPKGFLVMGVSGAGKTTLGKALARRLGWEFIEADDFHPPENIAKMKAGIPLSDADRYPWLDSLHDRLLYTLAAGRHPVLACSALREVYRARLLEGLDGVIVIHLRGTYDLIFSRMSARQDHFMRPQMLQSQFEALEEPRDAITLDAGMALEEMVEAILKKCGLSA